MKINISLFLLAIFCSCTALNAQTTIEGIITDSEDNPISYANILLLRADSSFVKGVVSDMDGHFILQTDKNESLLKITSLGYQDTFIDSKNRPNLNTIRILEDNYILGEIVVKAKKNNIQLKNNAMIVNVAASSMASLGNAKDVLTKVPGLVQDNNGGLYFFGKGTPIIYINDRKVKGSELEMLKSEDIKEIEILKNPGAKYDASSRAVILIRTVNPIKNYVGGFLYTSLAQGRRTSNNNQIHSVFNKDKINSTISLSASNRKKKSTSKIDKLLFSDILWHDKSTSQFVQDFNTYDVEATMNWEANDKNTLGFQYNYTYTPNKIKTNTRDVVGSDNTSDIDNLTIGKTIPHTNTHNLNLFHNLKLGTFSSKLNLDYVFNKQKEDQHLNETSNATSKDIAIFNKSTFHIFVAKLDMAKELIKDQELSFGVEYNYTTGDSKLFNEQHIIPSNETKNTENKVAPYLQYNLNKKVQAQIGLRYEHVYQKIAELYADKMSKQYDKIFPSFSVSWPISDKLSMQSAYNVNISRPSYRQLNNQISYISQYHYEVGNPKLKPSYTHNIMYALQYGNTILSVEYSKTNDFITLSSYIDQKVSSRTIGTFMNYPKSEQLQISLSNSFTLSIWENQTSFALAKPWFKGTYMGTDKWYNNPMCLLTINNTLNISETFALNINYSMYSDGNEDGFAQVRGRNLLDFGLRKSFFDKRLTIRAQVIDILKSAPYKYKFNQGYIKMSNYSDEDNRYIQLSVIYRFNSIRMKYKGSRGSYEEVNRL